MRNNEWWKFGFIGLALLVAGAALDGLGAPRNSYAAMGHSLACSLNVIGLILAGAAGYVAPDHVAKRLSVPALPSWASLVGAAVGVATYVALIPMPRNCSIEPI
jgi:hypothetical protein